MRIYNVAQGTRIARSSGRALPTLFALVSLVGTAAAVTFLNPHATYWHSGLSAAPGFTRVDQVTAVAVLATATLTLALLVSGYSGRLAVVVPAVLTVAIPLLAVVADNNHYLNETGCVLKCLGRSWAGPASANWVGYYVALTVAAGLAWAVLATSHTRADKAHASLADKP